MSTTSNPTPKTQFMIIATIFLLSIACTEAIKFQFPTFYFNEYSSNEYNDQKVNRITPVSDIFETESDIVILCNLPGVSSPNLEVEGNKLIVSGKFDYKEFPLEFKVNNCKENDNVNNENNENSEKRNDKDDRIIFEGKYLKRERALQRDNDEYYQEYKLNVNFDEKNIEAKMKNGLLTIVIPKSASVKIPISIS